MRTGKVLSAVGFLVIAGLLLGILIGCGGGPAPTEEPVSTSPAATQPPPTAAAPSPTPAEEPAAGGELTFGLYQEISDSLDPHVTNGSVNALVYFHTLDPLVWKTSEGYVPGLAESWEISPDATEYTFHLRKDVTFQDGTPFNAEAVKANFDRIVNPETQSRIALGYMGTYAGTEVVDDYTVTVKFEEPYAAFLDSVSQAFLGIVSPSAVEEWGADFGVHQVGTGPFMLDEYVPGERVVLVRNPDYNWAPDFFDHQGPAYLEKITFIMLLEDVARVGALENGEVQAIEKTPSMDIPRLKEEGYDLDVLPQTGLGISLMINTQKPPLDDVAVRQALNYAVNQDELVDTLFPGVYKPAHGPMMSATWGYNPAVEDIYHYDPEQAKALLEQAGWEVGADGIRVKDGEPLDLELVFLSGTGFDETWELVQAQLREVGVNASLNGMAASAALEKATAGDFNMMHLRWTFSDPDTMTVMWHSKNIAGGTGFNFCKVANTRIDELLDQAAGEPDLETRRAMYYEIQDIIMENAYMIPIYEEGNAITSAPTVSGMRFDPRGRSPLLYDVAAQ